MSKKRKTKDQVSYWIEKADKAFSDYIRTRDNFTCFTCGKHGDNKNIHCGHFITRGKHNTRYNFENCHAQCFSCNIGKMGNKEAYAVRLENIYGYGILQKLENEGNKSKKFTIKELQDIIEECNNLLKNL